MGEACESVVRLQQSRSESWPRHSCRNAMLLSCCLVVSMLAALSFANCRPGFASLGTGQQRTPVQLQDGSNIAGLNVNHGLCPDAPKLTLITPWGRNSLDYLPIITRSIKWECITQWVIAYDLHRVQLAKPNFKGNSKVLELFYNAPDSTSGNLQRQEALQRVKDGMVYFLDDDNAMHTKFWQWFAANASLGHIYTFDQLRGPQPELLRGGNPVLNCIDTAQLLFDRALLGNISWIANQYDADGRFIQALVEQHRDKHIYVPKVLAYHNFAQHFVASANWTRLSSPDAAASQRTWEC